MDRLEINDQVVQQLVGTNLSRRNLLKRAGVVGFSVVGMSTLLAACGGDDDDDTPDTAPEPTTPPAAEADPTATSADASTPEPEATSEPEATEEPEATSEPEPTEEPDEETPEAEPEGGIVRYHYGSAPRTLNPLFSTSNREHGFQAMMFGSLVRVDDGFEAILSLASAVEISEDAMQFTFELHDNILFTDGEQLTSDDIRFSFERALNPATASVWRGRFLGIAGAAEFADGSTDNVEGIVTPDDLTVTFNLSAPNAVFLLTICGTAGFGILPQHVLEDVAPEDMATHGFSTAPTVSAGAFKFVRYETDQYIEWERHEDYFGDRPAVDRIFALILDPNVATAQIETGEIDILPSLGYEEIGRTEALDSVTVHSVRSAQLFKITVNLNRPYLQDKRVRQAMAYAIDDEGLMQATVLGNGRVVHHPFIEHEWTQDIDGINEYAYDPDRARALLAEAGWDSQQRVELTYVSGSADWIVAAFVFIQQLWADVGIELDLVPVDSSELNVRTIDNDDFDLRPFTGATVDPDSHATSYSTQSIPPAGTNQSRFSNERVDELFAAGRATPDIDERAEIYAELALILNDELPELYLFSPNNISVAANRVVGYIPPALRDNTLWSVTQWSIDD